MSDTPKRKRGRERERPGPYRWAVRLFSWPSSCPGLSLASETSLSGAGAAAAALVLAVFIGLGILFDIIGVAVTAADPRPFHSMAAHKEQGAKEALVLLRNAGAGVQRLQRRGGRYLRHRLRRYQRGDRGAASDGTGPARACCMSVGVTALVSGLTIGGKALGKPFAMNQSKRVVYLGGPVSAFVPSRLSLG